MNTLIIIPAHNESQNLSNVLERLLLKAYAVDIVVIDDGSSDQTKSIARQFPVAIVSHPCNLGYGAALQTGYKYATLMNYTHVIQFDADDQHNPADVAAILATFEAEDVDLIIGSRFVGDIHFSPGAMKMLAIYIFRTMIYAITQNHVTDPTSGLRGLRATIFHYYADFNRFPSDFPDADFLIDALLRKFRVAEVPIRHHQRKYGVSMHQGWKPIVYIFKVLLSISVIVMNHLLVRRRGARE